MKRIHLLSTVVLFMSLSYTSEAQKVTSNYNSGQYGDYYSCTTQSPNSASVVSNRIRTRWYESNFNSSDRMTKGAEICADWSTVNEGWMGFSMYLGSDYPDDAGSSAVAQIFQTYTSTWGTWAAMLEMHYGDLRIVRRSSGSSSAASTSNPDGINTEIVAYNYPTQEWADIIIYFKVSNQNEGSIHIWIDGVKRYERSYINFGFASSWDSNNNQQGDGYIGLKLGQYNHSFNSSTESTSAGQRSVYYDNTSYYTGTSNGYSQVNPSNNNRLVNFSEEEVEQTELSVYPNPISNVVNAKFKADKYLKYSILNIEGKQLDKAEIASGIDELNIDVENLSKGVYILRLEGQDTKTIKLFKE